MKKTLLVTALALGLMISGSAFAAGISVGNVKVNLPSAPKTTAKTTAKTTTATKSANAQKIEAQIKALNNKLASVSSNYEKTVNDLVNNIATGKDLTDYKAKVAKLQASAKSATEVNIDIAEDGTVTINNALKNMSADSIKKLPAAKKAAIQNDLNKLKTSATGYNGIIADTAKLVNLIKNDPTATLSNASELITLTKTSKEATKQAKNITKLSSTIVTSFAKAGVKLK